MTLSNAIYTHCTYRTKADVSNSYVQFINTPFRTAILAHMEIKQQDNGKKGMFYIEVDSKVEGEMTYVWAGDHRIIIDHTQVGDKLKGQNAGKQLVHQAVEFAREKQIKILPLCPFARSVFEKTPEYQDVLS